MGISHFPTRQRCQIQRQTTKVRHAKIGENEILESPEPVFKPPSGVLGVATQIAPRKDGGQIAGQMGGASYWCKLRDLWANMQALQGFMYVHVYVYVPMGA